MSINMEMDTGSQLPEDDDISARAKKYVAEKRNSQAGGNGEEGGSALVSSRSSTSSAIFRVKSHSLNAPNLNGQELSSTKNYGSFYNHGTIELKNVKLAPLLRKV